VGKGKAVRQKGGWAAPVRRKRQFEPARTQGSSRSFSGRTKVEKREERGRGRAVVADGDERSDDLNGPVGRRGRDQ